MVLIGNILQQAISTSSGCLRHYGLTLAKPQGGIEEARQKCRAGDCFGVENHPCYEALSRERSGIEPDRSQIAEGGEPSHTGRTVLSQVAGLTNDLLQYIIRNAWNAQVRSSKIKWMFVSRWCKFEKLFLHTVPAIQNAEDL